MLQQFVHSQVDGELTLAPGFPAPPNTDYVGYHTYIGMFTEFVKKYLYKE
jgi:dynein heavy chain